MMTEFQNLLYPTTITVTFIEYLYFATRQSQEEDNWLLRKAACGEHTANA